jgi:hypothetical protein
MLPRKKNNAGHPYPLYFSTAPFFIVHANNGRHIKEYNWCKKM